MPRPKSIEKEKNDPLSKDMLDARQEEFDGKVSGFLRCLMEVEGISMSTFSRRVGFSQANVSNVFNPARKTNHWSIPLLLAVADALGTTMGELISAAENFSPDSGERSVLMFLTCRNTKPFSRERLRRIVWVAVGYTPEKFRKEDRYLIEQSIDLRNFESGVPSLCNLYYSGGISDEGVLSLMDRASAWAHHPDRDLDEDNPPAPLWTALSKIWTPPARSEQGTSPAE